MESLMFELGLKENENKTVTAFTLHELVHWAIDQMK